MIRNIKKGTITSAFGVLFLLGALIYSVYPLIFKEYEVNVALLLVSSSIGVGLLLSPDSVFKSLIDKIK